MLYEVLLMIVRFFFNFMIYFKLDFIIKNLGIEKSKECSMVNKQRNRGLLKKNKRPIINESLIQDLFHLY